MNIVVLRGRLSRDPEEQYLSSGARLVRYEVTTRRGDEAAESAPVSWVDAPAAAVKFSAGDEVVVVGRVRRRWFRRGAGTESRTEVAADQVIGVRRAAAVSAAIERVQGILEG